MYMYRACFAISSSYCVCVRACVCTKNHQKSEVAKKRERKRGWKEIQNSAIRSFVRMYILYAYMYLCTYPIHLPHNRIVASSVVKTYNKPSSLHAIFLYFSWQKDENDEARKKKNSNADEETQRSWHVRGSRYQFPIVRTLVVLWWLVDWVWVGGRRGMDRHMHTHIYIYMCVNVCVCVHVRVGWVKNRREERRKKKAFISFAISLFLAFSWVLLIREKGVYVLCWIEPDLFCFDEKAGVSGLGGVQDETPCEPVAGEEGTFFLEGFAEGGRGGGAHTTFPCVRTHNTRRGLTREEWCVRGRGRVVFRLSVL